MNGLNGAGVYNPYAELMKGFNSIDAATLMDKPLPNSCFLVDGLVPEGVNMISDAPKVGKSWLMLDLALSIASGEPFLGQNTAKCGVLYLCLEDTLKRIQDRLMKLTDEAPANLRFAVTAGTLGGGFEEELKNYLHSNPDTKLVIIDTLQRIRSPKSNGSGGIYANDYEDISALKEIAASRNVSILLVHHLRKQKDSDVFNQVSGSSGITGAVDTSYVLQKESRESKTATLIATGRDIEMQKITLKFENLRWVFVERKDGEQIVKEKAPLFLTQLVDFMRDRTEWTGTATELLENLNDPITPATMVKNQIVKYYCDILEPVGIVFDSKKTKTARLLTFRKGDGVTEGDGENDM